jgi:hypothetical protein
MAAGCGIGGVGVVTQVLSGGVMVLSNDVAFAVSVT